MYERINTANGENSLKYELLNSRVKLEIQNHLLFPTVNSSLDLALTLTKAEPDCSDHPT